MIIGILVGADTTIGEGYADMELRFSVQGSSPQPYTVVLRRVGDDLQTSCTCQAGQKGMYCKHRLSILRGDYSAVVSDNREDFQLIPDLLRDTDVAVAMGQVQHAEQAADLIAQKYALKPPAKRQRVADTVAVAVLQKGGFLKGTGAANFLDVYDNSDRYCGSLKTCRSVFWENPVARFGRNDVMAIVRTDRQIHDRSQGLYIFLEGSSLAQSLTAEDQVRQAKRRLKQAMK